ncbi:MAG: hypothetical protein WCJ09_25320 [Planctomycetota bacterium]
MYSNTPWAEGVLLLPLWLVDKVVGRLDQPGMLALAACVMLFGIWITVFRRWWYAPYPARFIGVYLIAVMGLPLVIFLSIVCAPQQFLDRQFLIVVQVYFCLSALTLCDCYWNHRPRSAWVTAGIATLTTFPIWLVTGFCWALTRQ